MGNDEMLDYVEKSRRTQEFASAQTRKRVINSLVIIFAAVLVAAMLPIFSQNELLMRLIFRGYEELAIAQTAISLTSFMTFAAAGFVFLRLFLEFGGDLSRIIRNRPISYPIFSPPPAPQPYDSQPKHAVIQSGGFSHEVIAGDMLVRLVGEIAAQGRKADTNLLIGGFLAVIAAGFLAWLAFDGAAHLKDLETSSKIPPMLYWGAFAAKIALSVTANIFAFFFLSTYRRNLSEIKYFQNELTNIECKLIALSMAQKESKLIKDVVSALLKVERNFVLRKGETTVGLSQLEIEKYDGNALTSILAKALGAAQKAKGKIGIATEG
jgi:hypothetical protein